MAFSIKHAVSKTLGIGRRILAYAIGLPTLISYWSGAYNNIDTVLTNSKPKISSNADIPPDSLIKLTKEAKSAFKNVTFIYEYRGSQDVEKDLIKLSQKEKDFIKDKMQSCEVLDYCSNETGLRAAALRDKNTKEITLVIAGGDFSQKDQKLSQDIDDVWASTKGKLGDQFPEVYKFAKNVEAKFGKIDLITGHSLGGNNTLNLAYGFPDAKKIAFDCTGLQFSSEKRLSDFYTEKCGHDVSIADIRNATKDVIRIKPGKDVYNALGSVGIDLTMVEPSKDNYSALTNTGTFMQNQHLYGKVFFKNMSDDNLKLYQDKSKGGYSGTPIELSLVFLAALATCAYKNRKRFSSWASKVKSGKNPEPVHGAEIS